MRPFEARCEPGLRCTTWGGQDTARGRAGLGGGGGGLEMGAPPVATMAGVQ